MYHINPAVTKSLLSSMPQAQLAQHMAYISQQAAALPLGCQRSKFVRLYQFCLSLPPGPAIHQQLFGA